MTRNGHLVLAAVLLMTSAPGAAGGADAEPYPEPVAIGVEDCDFEVGETGGWRWRCPVVATPGWARLDFELDQPTNVALLHGGRDEDPAFQATQGWVDLHRDGDWEFLGATHATRGHSDYERTVVKVGDGFHYEEERESEASGTDSRGTFNRGHGMFFEAGSHSLILIYAWHHTANTEDTFLDLLASEGLTDWALINHPGRAWLYDDSDFRVDVLQVRRDGSEAGDVRGINVIVDATLTHSVEDRLTGLFNVRGEQTNGAVGMLGIEGEERSCRYQPNGVYPFNASLHIPPSPSGDYTFRIEAKVERHVYPHSVLLLADVDVPVQPWPPGVFADDTVNEVVMGTFCDGD